MIKINCKGSRELKLSEIKAFQGKLKDVSDVNLKKIIKSIEKYGFIQPFAIWQDKNGVFNILDGHTRLKALEKMGIDFKSKFPVYDVHAKTEKEARQILLQKSSEYGKITKDGLQEFMEMADLNLDDVKDEFELPNIDLNKLDIEDKEVQEVNFTQELSEEHNYLVLYWDNSIDWQQALTMFAPFLKTVKALSSKKNYEKKGIGRVISGVDFINSIIEGIKK